MEKKKKIGPGLFEFITDGNHIEYSPKSSYRYYDSDDPVEVKVKKLLIGKKITPLDDLIQMIDELFYGDTKTELQKGVSGRSGAGLETDKEPSQEE